MCFTQFYNIRPASIKTRATICPPVKHHSDSGPILHAYWACGYVYYVHVTDTMPLEIKLLSESFN